jgi:hypothetical protein
MSMIGVILDKIWYNFFTGFFESKLLKNKIKIQLLNKHGIQ